MNLEYLRVCMTSPVCVSKEISHLLQHVRNLMSQGTTKLSNNAHCEHQVSFPSLVLPCNLRVVIGG
jgi:hypothetical protein